MKRVRESLTPFSGQFKAWHQFFPFQGMPWCHKATTSTIEPGTESRRRVFAWVPLEKVIENSVAVAEAHSSQCIPRNGGCQGESFVPSTAKACLQGDLATGLACIPVIFCADATSLWKTAAHINLQSRHSGKGLDSPTLEMTRRHWSIRHGICDLRGEHVWHCK